MRLFVAIVLPGEFSSEIDKSKKKLEFEGVKTTVDSHITLQFLGDVDDIKVSKLKNKLKEIKFNSFKLTMGKTKIVPSDEYVDRVHIEFNEDSGFDSLNQLHLKVKNATKGFAKEESKGFLPHITLARVKFLKDKKKFVDAVHKINFSGRVIDVNEFYLIKSNLTEKGPEYEFLERVGC